MINPDARWSNPHEISMFMLCFILQIVAMLYVCLYYSFKFDWIIELGVFWICLRYYPGVENVLFFVLTTRSQQATNWQPDAALKPLTLAITGTGDWIISSISSVDFANTCRCSCCPFSIENSFKLWPAEKTGPVADKTMHRKFSSFLLRRKFFKISVIMSNESAFLNRK